jgi:hypothetical protein
MSGDSNDEDIFGDEHGTYVNASFSDDEEENEVPDWAGGKKKSPDSKTTTTRSTFRDTGHDMQVLEASHQEEMSQQREINNKYMARLKRRSALVTSIRKAYLRDIVCLKQVINEQLSKDERIEVAQNWKKMIPSIDIRQHLMLYGPQEASIDTIPCDSCGGSVELVHHDSSEIEELSKALSHMDKNKDDLRLIIATKGALLDNVQEQMGQVEKKHSEEVY